MENKVIDDINKPIERRDGYTIAERYLKKLCERSFFSLWSYSSVFRDQGQPGKAGDGKEVCDLLVVFQEHIIIFSDKDCVFPDTGNLKLDWKRWYKRAIYASAKQIWGAERWIKKYPKRLFLDSACTQPFPIELPNPSEAKFHHVVVAHGVAKRCKEVLGGSGSLIIAPPVIGKMHLLDIDDDHNDSKKGEPFVVGQIDLAKGYTHIFDDTSLDIVMSELDTITDFVSYLSKKEKFIQSGRLMVATGEEDLLAYYLQSVDASGNNDFIMPEGYEAFGIGENFWNIFTTSIEYQALKARNLASYSWDRFIKISSDFIINGTQYAAYIHFPQAGKFAPAEQCMRILAKEPRARRRDLSLALGEFLKKSPSSIPLSRVVVPSETSYPYYVFLLSPRPKYGTDKEYRDARMAHLYAQCMVTKLVYPQAVDIIGIATESVLGDYIPHSEDVIYLSGQNWNEEDYEEAKRLQKEFKFYSNVSSKKFREWENSIIAPTMKGKDRNKLCPCGSGKKYKKCCGA